jgi:tetratricopeptide (TPR) repeat protein
VEQPRACPGRIAFLAGRYAALLALRPDAGDFPSRFFLYMVLRCHWDACLTDGLQWGREGVALFPRDPSLLFSLGADLEEIAVLGAGDVTTVSIPLGAQQRAMMITRAREQKKLELYRESRHFYESALKLDPERGLARLRLGVVSWRLHDMESARAALQQVTEQSHEAKSLFLAHLYLGRVQEDESRFDDAESEYRLALSLDPGAQSAAVALSHLLRLQGDGDASRQVLLTALSRAPRRERRDAFWDYLGGSDEHIDALLAALHREAEGE